jgi:endo-alpha-1,4-polygalactosaminidase (GH114 family)
VLFIAAFFKIYDNDKKNLIKEFCLDDFGVITNNFENLFKKDMNKKDNSNYAESTDQEEFFENETRSTKNSDIDSCIIEKHHHLVYVNLFDKNYL